MKVLRILPALLLFGFIGWIIVQANNGSRSVFFDLVHFVPHGDKLGHFVLYGTLSLLTVIAFKYKCIAVNNYRFPIGAIIVLLIAIIEEITQLFLSNRTFDMIDIIAGFAGIVIFMWILKKSRAANFEPIKPSS